MTKIKPELTQARVRELFGYNSDTGEFVRLNSIQGGKSGLIRTKRRGYLSVKIDYVMYSVHRVIWLWMTGAFPKDQIDHINHIRDDNRWVNLREATQRENASNVSKSKRNRSGVVGVAWHVGKWRVKIHFNGKDIYLGRYSSLSEAAKVRKCADVKYGYHKNHGASSV